MQALAANPNPGSKSHEDDRLSKRSLALRYPSPLPTALERPAGFASVVRGLYDVRDGEAVRACFSLFHFFFIIPFRHTAAGGVCCSGFHSHFFLPKGVWGERGDSFQIIVTGASARLGSCPDWRAEYFLLWNVQGCASFRRQAFR